MREIKFRAWDKENKEMLEVQELDYEDSYDGKPMIRTTMYNDYFDEEDMILMQYTGLKDRNGVEIYEGDIIACMTNDGKELYKSIVKYGKFNCSCCNGVYGWYFDGGDIRDCEYDLCEVIGNIYENPDLLKR